MQLFNYEAKVLDFRWLEDRPGCLLIYLKFIADESVGSCYDESGVEDGKDD